MSDLEKILNDDLLKCEIVNSAVVLISSNGRTTIHFPLPKYTRIQASLKYQTFLKLTSLKRTTISTEIMATVSCLTKTPHDNVGNHYEPFKNRIMAKKVYALYRTDNWHTYDSRELLVLAGSIRRCCKVAKDIDTYTLNESLIS